MKSLDPFSLPLNQSCLIEASAGTGKTYTIVNLYLRLVLGVGCTPLSVEQILVVTFTNAATEELRERIRSKISEVAGYFKQQQTADCPALQKDRFLAELYQAVAPRLAEALLRLKIAEQEMDLASIFTIHSFCQKMLYQFAFNSGMRFDIDLQPNDRELLTCFSQGVWRALFYPLDKAQAAVVAQELGTPENALKRVKPFLSGIQPELSREQAQWVATDLGEYLAQQQQCIAQLKAYWCKFGAQIIAIVRQEQEKKYTAGVKKALNRRKLNTHHLALYESTLNEWAQSCEPYVADKLAVFTQSNFDDKAEEGAEPLRCDYFREIENQLNAYRQQFEQKTGALLSYQFLTALHQRIADYKQTHPERNFNDMLSELHRALNSERGEALAEQIRHQFAFAMIDEFQDTDREQYDIFSRIFMARADQGFIMIGDPKQSIYQFRGADIFTYLYAAKQVQHQATLNRNWRSLPKVVEACNRLFDFPPNAAHPPFIYDGIPFHAVEFNPTDTALHGQAEAQFFLTESYQLTQAAQHCAAQIQRQLQLAEQGQFYWQNTDKITPAAQDIAVLVRNRQQALAIQQALAARHIQAVFLSEKRSVYATPEAADLAFVLKACLAPYDARALLAALGCSLWGLNANEIYQLKQNEQQWDNYVARFTHYNHVWKQHGVLPMLQQLFLQEGLIERLRAQPNADRRITDLLHLAELLQGAQAQHENDAALLRWYEKQLQQPEDNQQDQILRLESEANLVKIVTIHGSKGLEYPIVWLPFVADASKGAKKSELGIYHDTEQNAHWYLGEADDEIQLARDRAEFAEELRLLYVAVTRAKYQLNLILPQQFEQGWNAVHYLLSHGEIGLAKKSEASRSTAELLQANALAEPILLPAVAESNAWKPSKMATEAYEFRHFNGKIRQNGQITSFSALYGLHDWLSQRSQNFVQEGQDYDREPQHFHPPEADDAEQIYSPYQFPHSVKVGHILHRFFEYVDFSRPVEPTKIAELCAQLELSEAWHAPVQQWFENIRQTPLADGAFRLADCQPQKRLNEWQFYLRLSNPKALPRLNALLKQHSKLGAQLPELQLPQIEGFVRGFIDCIVEQGGKFYLIDYKSNFLGAQAQDYAADSLAQAMGQYRYDLQYLLYTLAFHRYLRFRLGEKYDYARDFGGVAYLFLRGMDGKTDQGVFFDKPQPYLIDEMDTLFG